MASLGCWDRQQAARAACLQATGCATRALSSTSPCSLHAGLEPAVAIHSANPQASQLSSLGTRMSGSTLHPSPCPGSLPGTAQPPNFRTSAPPQCCSRAELPSHPVPETCPILRTWKQRHCCKSLGNVIWIISCFNCHMFLSLLGLLILLLHYILQLKIIWVWNYFEKTLSSLSPSILEVK